MTKAEFSKEMQDLGNAYRGKFVINVSDLKEDKEEVLQTWYKFLEEFDADVFNKVVWKWIVNNTIPPTIKDLRKECKEHQSKKNKEKEKEEEMTDEEWVKMVQENW